MSIENPTELSIVLLLAYYAILLLTMASFRTGWSLRQNKAANTFDPAGKDVGAFGQRLTRVHANTYESVPFYLAALLFALASDQANITDGLALLLVVLRAGQGLTHLLSTSVVAVMVRFLVFFAPQLGILIYWVIRFLA